jgi:SAM-dependent methyltransferase
MKEVFAKQFKKFIGKNNLELGPGRNPEESTEDAKWTSVDMDSTGPADVIFNLHNIPNTPLPFADESFDTVLASHVLEHIRQERLPDVIYELARVLRTGGHLIAIVPHGMCDGAWDNPHHRQLFSPNTFAYFDRRLYEQENTAGTGAGQGYNYALWSLQHLTMTPSERWRGQPELEIAAAGLALRNVFDEIQCVLRKEGM